MLVTGTGTPDVQNARRFRCGPCCIHGNCENVCQECLPRYLCVNAFPESSTGTGTGSGSGTGTPGCCYQVAFRMYPHTPCGWSGQFNLCTGQPIGTINVVVLAPGTGTGTDGIGTGSGTGTGECVTRVTGTFFNGHHDFRGIVKDVSFSVTVDGIAYTVNITKANTVPNPQAFGKCATCTCVTCLPAQLCVRIAGSSAIANWDCINEEWVCPPIPTELPHGTGTDLFETFTIKLRMAKPEDKLGCEVIGSAQGPHGLTNFHFALESPVNQSGGVTCIEEGGELTIGEGRNAMNVFTRINFSVNLNSTGTDEHDIVTLTVQDRSCGEECAGPCCGLQLETYRPLKRFMTVQIEQCAPFLIEFGDDGWVGVTDDSTCTFCFGNCGVQIALNCIGGCWNLFAGCPEPGNTVHVSKMRVQCDPFMIEAHWKDPRGSMPTTDRCGDFNITVTEAF